jgi:hypothetical protein
MAVNDTKPDFPVTVSVHPEAGLDDLTTSGITWGTLIDPGLALLAAPPAGRAGDLSRPLRLLAGPPEPAPGTLLDVPVARTLHLRGPQGRVYLVMQADLNGWTWSGEAPWTPGADDVFDDAMAALADQLLSRCTAPNEHWLDRCGKARAGMGRPPHPYPFPFPPVPGSSMVPESSVAAEPAFGTRGRRKRPMWLRLLESAVGRHPR